VDELRNAVFAQAAGIWRAARPDARPEALELEGILAPAFAERLAGLDPVAVATVLLTVSAFTHITLDGLDPAAAKPLAIWSDALGLLGSKLYSRDT
jgi:hypothetical protein